ncbi:hypothetical protein FIBSPDRAFT_927707 [Athelia psychrophila]|uniref:Uncharacterized protein n=1 Tax=Athelia psychrophila TaxID=1759441 RepID=A0A166RJ72_9AGAM|nr:hypothetical protein FIBSPDRAFT_927707 [Fibularhizoctonia sp. CBS 109695]
MAKTCNWACCLETGHAWSLLEQHYVGGSFAVTRHSSQESDDADFPYYLIPDDMDLEPALSRDRMGTGFIRAARMALDGFLQTPYTKMNHDSGFRLLRNHTSAPVYVVRMSGMKRAHLWHTTSIKLCSTSPLIPGGGREHGGLGCERGGLGPWGRARAWRAGARAWRAGARAWMAKCANAEAGREHGGLGREHGGLGRERGWPSARVRVERCGGRAGAYGLG